MLKKLITIWFKTRGWRFTGPIPKKLRKCMVIVAPHSSYQDFILGVAVGKLSKYKARFAVSEKLFKFPLSKLLNHLGARPFNLTEQKETEKELKHQFSSRRRYALVISPNTLSELQTWNEAFYEVSIRSKIPLAMAYIDYEEKHIRFHSWFNLSGDKNQDILYMKAFFARAKAKNSRANITREKEQSLDIVSFASER